MAKREVKPTEQDTHPPRTDMEKLEAIRKIVMRNETSNPWYIDEDSYTQKFRLQNYELIWLEIHKVFDDNELEESFYRAANSYS